MADPRFFKKMGPFSLQEIAKETGAHLIQDTDEEIMIEDVAPLNTARPEHVTFLDNVRYKVAFEKTQAAACFVSPEIKKIAPAGIRLLVTKNPYKAFALCAQKFYPGEVDFKPVISECAIVHPSAQIGEGARIDAGVVIGENVVIGGQSWVGANAVISHALIGNEVRIYPGVCIGQDGFGFAIDPGGHVKLPQLGRVIIEDRVEIGANTTIDRGAGPDTFIGKGTWIDNLVQIGHNVRIGQGCVIVAQVGISGSTIIEDGVMIGGQAGLAGHLRVGKGVRIGAQAGIMRSVPEGLEVMGSPAVPIRDFMRQSALLQRMGRKDKKEQ